MAAEAIAPDVPPSFRHRLRRFRFRYDEALWATLFLGPGLLGWVIFIGVPTISAFVLAFYKFNLFKAPIFVGIENFAKLTADRVFQAALINTVYFTFATVILSVALGLALAILVDRKLRGFIMLRSMLLLPYVMVMAAVAAVFRFIYLPEVGLLNEILLYFGVAGPNWLSSELWAMPALIIMSVWKSFGYNMFLFIAGLQAIPTHLYEAAEIDGANAWHKFIYVTVPMLSPTTFFVVVISIIGSFQVFDQAYIMTRGGPGTSTTTLVMYIYQMGFQRFEMGIASAAAFILFLLILIVTLVQFIGQRRWVHYEG